MYVYVRLIMNLWTSVDDESTMKAWHATANANAKSQLSVSCHPFCPPSTNQFTSSELSELSQALILKYSCILILLLVLFLFFWISLLTVFFWTIFHVIFATTSSRFLFALFLSSRKRHLLGLQALSIRKLVYVFFPLHFCSPSVYYFFSHIRTITTASHLQKMCGFIHKFTFTIGISDNNNTKLISARRNAWWSFVFFCSYFLSFSVSTRLSLPCKSIKHLGAKDSSFS